MATFPSIEASFGFTKKSQPNTRIVKYADGYEHRILFGLASHQNPETYDLTWQNITETESDVIEAFLRTEANNSTSFTYSPPSEGFTKTGTYSQTATTVTITITDHGGGQTPFPVGYYKNDPSALLSLSNEPPADHISKILDIVTSFQKRRLLLYKGSHRAGMTLLWRIFLQHIPMLIKPL